VAVFLNGEFDITFSFFDCCLFLNAYEGKKEIMNSNKEVNSVLKFTVLCDVFVVLLSVLQWCE
jgi:hypothetical protein